MYKSKPRLKYPGEVVTIELFRHGGTGSTCRSTSSKFTFKTSILTFFILHERVV